MITPSYSYEEAQQLINSGAQLVDVRSPAEFAGGALSGAINLPLQEIDSASATLNPDQVVLVYCGTGKRSEQARELLLSQGFECVHNLGGYGSILSSHQNGALKVSQLFDADTSTYTYLLWDPVSRDAALIDTVKEQVARDLYIIRDLNLNLRYTMETHIHADHVTGAGELRKALGSKSAVHKNSGATCADVMLNDGDVLRLGNEEILAIHTPGHTDSDISFKIPGAVFTGDALLIEGCGRTDFQSGDAATLYQSITQKLFNMPEDTVVYPAHDYNGRSDSTIGHEKAHNPRLGAGKTEHAFVQLMANLKLDPPKLIELAVPGNQNCGL